MSYYESRAVLRSNDPDEIEIEIRGGVEADDQPGGYEIVVRIEGEDDARMRVRPDVWRKFVRAVGRLR